jgi:hypothetical protein
MTIAGDDALRYDQLANPQEVESGTVVLTANDDALAFACERQVYIAVFVFTAGDSLARAFDAMVDGISNDMHQRIDDAVEDLAVDLHLLSADVQARILLGRAAGLPYPALQPRHDSRNRYQARGEHDVVQLRADLLVVHDQSVELVQLRSQKIGELAGVGQSFGKGIGGTVQLAVLVELQRVEILVFHACDRKQRAARRWHTAQLNQILKSRETLRDEHVLLAELGRLNEALLLPTLDLDDGGGELARQAQQVVDGIDGHTQRGGLGARLRGCRLGHRPGDRNSRLRRSAERHGHLGLRGRLRECRLGQLDGVGGGLRRIGELHRIGLGHIDELLAFDAPYPVDQPSQHTQRLRRRRAHSEQMLHHDLQAVACVEERFTQPRRRKPFVTGEELEDVLHTMSEVRNAGNTGDIGRSLDGVRNALSLTDIVDAGVIVRDALHAL